MPRIDDKLLSSVFYLFRTRRAAEIGDPKGGGTGFFVGVISRRIPSQMWVCAVTNKHVVGANGASVIRVNSPDGSTDIIETEPDEWSLHPNGDDLAVFPVEPDTTRHKVTVIEEELLVTDEIIEYRSIGPGDEIYMIGRFINHDGRLVNHPSVRFGNISMRPASVRQQSGFIQESWAVEMRSMAGYSGSPVFISRLEPAERNNMWSPLTYFTWILGVNWGHITDHWPVETASRISEVESAELTEKRRTYALANTGMNMVVPAQRLRALLHIPKLEAYYDKMDEEYINKTQRNEIGAEPKTFHDDPQTRLF